MVDPFSLLVMIGSTIFDALDAFGDGIDPDMSSLDASAMPDISDGPDPGESGSNTTKKGGWLG